MKWKLYESIAKYRPITLYVKGQQSIHFDLNAIREKEILMRQIINLYFPNIDSKDTVTYDGKTFNLEFINKSQKNIKIMYGIVEISKEMGVGIKNSRDYINFIRDYKDELFNPGGQFFSRIYSLLEEVSEKGRDIEKTGFEFMKKTIFNKTGVSVEIRQPTPNEDKAGIDGIFNYKGTDYTLQIKTLTSIIKNGEFWDARITGDFTDITTNYVVFISDSEKYIFSGKGIRRFESPQTYYQIPESNLKSKEI